MSDRPAQPTELWAGRADPAPAENSSAQASPAAASADSTASADSQFVAEARSRELVRRIRAEIGASHAGRITFARFMELALDEPGLGYYRVAADRPTDAGDFLTAPETHPIFGWTLARRIEAMWVALGRPRPFALVEFGAGSGTLALSILDGLRRHGSELLEALRYEPIEANPNRLADLVRRFEDAGLADRLAISAPEPAALEPAALELAMPDLAAPDPAALELAMPEPATPRREAPDPARTGVVIANEFLDALPLHRVVRHVDRLEELFVTWDGGFSEVAADPSTPELAARLADDGVELADRQIAEICLGLGPWLDDVAGRLDRGYVIAIDYGYPAAELYGPRHLAGTLLGYRGHRVVEDPFTGIGLTDLTAHVDFTALIGLARSCGFADLGLATQSEFLVEAGLQDELRALQDSTQTAAADYLRARSGIVRMLDPRHMGRFRVLTLGRGGVPAAIGGLFQGG
jgi:SAM-dependent MidA family methyltransferase